MDKNKNVSGWMRRLVLAGVAGTLCACRPVPPRLVASAQTQEQSDAREDDFVFAVGDTVESGRLRVHLESVEFTEKEGDLSAPEGQCFLFVKLTLENVDRYDNLLISPLDWKVEDSDGLIVEYEYTEGGNRRILPDGELRPGGKTTGYLMFEVPKGDKAVKLQFAGNSLFEEPEFIFQFSSADN